MALFFFNILFTALIKFSSFKKSINFSQKKVKINFNSLIKTRHIIVFQDTISKFLPFNTCLVKALSIHKLSLMIGRNAKIYIGIAEEKGSLISHAWIEIEGVSYYHEPNKKYRPIIDY